MNCKVYTSDASGTPKWANFRRFMVKVLVSGAKALAFLLRGVRPTPSERETLGSMGREDPASSSSSLTAE